MAEMKDSIWFKPLSYTYWSYQQESKKVGIQSIWILTTKIKVPHLRSSTSGVIEFNDLPPWYWLLPSLTSFSNLLFVSKSWESTSGVRLSISGVPTVTKRKFHTNWTDTMTLQLSLSCGKNLTKPLNKSMY